MMGSIVILLGQFFDLNPNFDKFIQYPLLLFEQMLFYMGAVR